MSVYRDSAVWLALALTALNALKPPTVDDAAYVAFARHIAVSPLDPYGFDLNWYGQPRSAFEVLAPPVVLYWLAAGVTLFGERPWAWKLGLFPFALALTLSLRSLLRRFARGLETPLLVLVVASPAVLPAMNLMLDLPALSLELSAVAVFLCAASPFPRTAAAGRNSASRVPARRGIGLALTAGLLAGLAMQTKYTGVLAPAVMVLIAFYQRRWQLAGLALGMAGTMFIGWEWITAIRYGQSHFLFHALDDGPREPRRNLLAPMVSLLGATAPTVALLAVVAFGGCRLALVICGAVIAAGFTAVAFVPEQAAGRVFTAFGSFALTSVAVIAFRRYRRGNPDDRLLVLWLLAELSGAVILSPFPAARRVIGLTVVMTLLVGRYLCQSTRRKIPQRTILAVVLIGSLLGGGFAFTDWLDAYAERQAALTAAWIVQESNDGPRIWLDGHWGFRFAAEDAGMTPLEPDREIQPGDWLVVADPDRVRTPRNWPSLSATEFEILSWEITIDDFWPYRTVPAYYAGKVPLVRKSGPRFVVRLGRAPVDFAVENQPLVPEQHRLAGHLQEFKAYYNRIPRRLEPAPTLRSQP